MMRKVLDYGLKESYNFREIHVAIDQELTDFNKRLADVHNKIVTYITPTIIELEGLKLINGFHFILHESIDVRLSTEDWDKNEKKIRKILRKHNLSGDLEECGKNCEDDIGIILCYNNLEFNSRLISALLDAQKHTDDINMNEQLRLLHQWIHYLYIQYGITNDIQAQLEFQDSLNWLETIIFKNPEKIEVRNLVNDILNNMSNMINQFKNKINK